MMDFITGILPIVLIIATIIFFVSRSKKSKDKEEIYSREEKERYEEEKEAELEKIKKLILETEKIVEDAIPNARDPIVLGGLKILLDQIHILYQDFKSGKNHIKARSKVLAFREEARILITSASEKEATERSENKNNYYDILGINLNASQEDIKKAYRSKQKKIILIR